MTLRLSFSLLWAVCLTFGFSVASAAPIPVAEVKRDKPVDFETEILPLFNRSCLACHNAATAEGRLILETPQTILKGGDSGPAVVPMKSKESLLMAVATHESEPIMPPANNKANAKPLTSQELGLLKLWIDQGAQGMVTGKGKILAWQPLPPGVNPIMAVAVTPDAQFAAAGRANQIFIYHLPSKRVVSRLTDPALVSAGPYQRPGVAHLDMVQALAFNPAGDLLASGGFREIKIWRRPANVATHKLEGNAGAVAALAVSADQKLIALGGEDKIIRLYDVASGAPAGTIAGHAGKITGLRFAPDGSKLVSASEDKSVRIWSLPKFELLGRIDTPTPVTAVTVAGATANLVATAGAKENVVRVWNLPTEAPRLLTDAPKAITTLVASADKKLLAIGGGDGQVILFDAAAGKPTATIAAHTGAVVAAAFNLNNNRLATAGADQRVIIWDVATGKPVTALQPGLGALQAVALNPAGNQVAVSFGEGQIAVLKAEVPAVRPLNGENGAAPTVAATSPNGQLFACDGVADGKPVIFVREVASGNVAKTLVGHEGAITALAFSADNARLISGSADKTARVWTLADGKEVQKLAAHAQAVSAVALNSNGTQAATGCVDNVLKTWNVADGMELKALAGHTGAIACVAYAWNDSFVISGSADQTVKMWNPADGAAIRSIAAGGVVSGLALTRDNARAAVAVADKSVKIVQTGDGNVVHTLTGHTAPARSLAFSADNLRLLSAAPEKMALAWDAMAGKLIEVLPAAGNLAAVGFGPDANTVVTAAADKSLQVQTLHFERALAGNMKPITGLVYSNDGGLVVSAAADGSVRGFGAADGNQRWAQNHGAAVHDLAISADGQWLATAGEDKLVKIWNSSNGSGGPKPQLGPVDSPVTSVCFARDNLKVLAGTAASGLVAFDLMTGTASQAYAEPAAAVTAVAAIGEQSPVWIVATADGARYLPYLFVRSLGTHTAPVNAIETFAIAPAQIVTGGDDGTVRHWNLDNGQEMRQYPHGGPVTSLAIRPDGKRLVTGGANNVAKLFNAENGQPVAELRGDLRLQRALAKAQRTLQVGQQTAATKKQLFEAAQKDAPVKAEAAKKAVEALAAAQKTFDEKAAAAKTAADAKAVADKAAADAGAALKVAEDAAAKAKTALDGDANNKGLQDAKAAADKALEEAKKKATDAATAATNAAKPAEETAGAAKAAETARNQAKKASEEADVASKKAVELIPMSMADQVKADEAVKLFEAQLKAATEANTAGEKPIRAVAFAADGFTVATSGDDSVVHTFHGETGAPMELYLGQAGVIGNLAFIDGQRLVSGSADKSAFVWDLTPNWTLERTIGGADTADFIDRVISLKFSPDGQTLASGGGEPSRSGEVKLWNVADGKLIKEFADAHSDTVFGLDFSADGKYLASSAADKFVKVFEVATGTRVRSFEGHTHHVLGVAFRADNNRLMSCGADNVIKVWNFETGDQIATIQGYAKQVTSISFIGDSPITISSGGDGTVRMYNSDNNGNVRNFAGATDFVYAAASTPDGKLVIAGGQDGTLRTWNGENAQVIDTFAAPTEEQPANNTQAAK